ncbi:MAG: RNA polymerase sigma factor [Oricola sp.]|nr:RNA polymerase sigma factor [Oricola sp.]
MSEPDKKSHGPGGGLAAAFLQYREGLRRYVARLALRPEDVDDILQETFLSVHSLKDEHEIRSPKFYLFAVARRTAYRELKRQSSRIADSIEEAIEKGEEPAAAQAPLDQAFEAREYFEILTDLVSDFPPQCRRVFILRKIFGYSHKEISAMMGISTSTVEKYLARAMMRCLQDHRLQDFLGHEDRSAEAGAAPQAVKVKE